MPISRHPLMPCSPDDRGIRKIGIDPAVSDRLSESLVLLQTKGPAIVKAFYALLFERFPGVRAMFPSDTTRQERKLLDSLVLVVQHIRDPQRVTAALEDLGRRHHGYGARPRALPDRVLDPLGMHGSRTRQGLDHPARSGVVAGAPAGLANHDPGVPASRQPSSNKDTSVTRVFSQRALMRR